MIAHLAYLIIEILNYILIFNLTFGIELTKKPFRYFTFIIFLLCFNNIPYSVENDTLAFFLLGILMTFILIDDLKPDKFVMYISIFQLSHIFTLLFVYITAIITLKSFNELATNTLYSLFSSVCSTLFVFLFFLYLRFFKHYCEPLIIFRNRIHYVLLALSLFIITGVIGAIQALASFTELNDLLLNVVSLFIIILIILFFSMWIALSKSFQKQLFLQHQEEIAKLRISDQENRFAIIRDSDTALREFRHDMRSHMSILHELLNSKKYSEASNYLDNIGTAFKQADCITYTGISAVDAIISHHQQQMNYNHIKFKWFNSACSIPNTINAFDLCTIFDNILANALRSCENMPECNSTHPEVTIHISVKNTRLIIHQLNTALAPVIFGADGLPITTKDNKIMHGFGLQNIKHTVTNYNGVLTCSQTNGMFCVDIII